MRVRSWLAPLIVIALLGAGGYGAWRWFGSASTAMAEAGPAIPTARVTRGSLELTVLMPGELRATKQTQITAPAVGGNLRILSMSETGSVVEEGEPIMEFDPADQEFTLQQSRSELLEADQEIIKRQAELEVQAAQDKVTLLTAQFDVRRAELDARVDGSLVSANEAQIRQVSFEQAKRHLAQVEQDVASRQTTTKANLAILNERRVKANLAAERAQQSIEGLVLKAPMGGVVIAKENYDALGGVIIGGMPMPSYRVGDSVPAGRLVLEVYDVRTMEIRARVNEQERANVSIGQSALIRSDAVSGLVQKAKVLSIGGLGRADVRSGPLRQFDVILTMEAPDPRLLPGTSVTVELEGRKVDNALLLPRQCLFEKDGKPIVYVREATGFVARDIKVSHRTEKHIAIEGIDEGIEVAMINPDPSKAPRTPAAPAKAPAPGPVGVGK
jgi:multidrug resistance efflux pump